MANEIQVSYTSGFTLYANATHDVTGDVTKIDLTDDTGDSYTGDFTTDMALGLYVIEIYREAGTNDIFMGSGIVVWDGSEKGLENFVTRMISGDKMTWGVVGVR
jgi:hypothetical protein